MSAALVRHVHYRVAPANGPHGYLFNLREALLEHGSGTLKVEVLELPRRASHPSAGQRLWSLLFEKTPGLRHVNHRIQGEFQLRFKRSLKDWDCNYEWIRRDDCKRLFECDVLFAHDTFLARRLVRFCPRESRQRLVLMTHAPAFYALQIGGSLLPDVAESAWRDEPCVRGLIDEELAVMESARAVVWPCARAQEGYREWHQLHQAGRARSLFVQHAVPMPVPQTSRRAMRERWGVGAERVALFMGRPHPHKGFDRFLDWANESRRRGSRWVFVHAGSEAKNTRRELSSLRQVGFVEDNGAAYLASDLVLIPNRYSYLDFGVMQSLALGAPLALSPNGGHRDVAELAPRIPRILEAPPEEAWPRLEEAALAYAAEEAWRAPYHELWARHFSPVRWVRDHVTAMESLLAEERASMPPPG